MARALENSSELEISQDIVSVADTRVCRLTAKVETKEDRVRMRETGLSQPEYVARVAELNTMLDRVQLQDFCVDNEGRPVSEVALEVLTRAAWILQQC